MVIPGELTMAPASYDRFLDQYEQFQHQRSPHASQLGPKIRCQQQELLGASNNYNFSSTSARGIEYCYLKGPGMQQVASPAAAESVWEGSSNVIRPSRFNTDHLSYEQLSSYRRPDQETFNASDIPIRSSVSKSTTETPKKSYLGPESMPTFEEWVLQKPLGRQLLQDPPDVLDALCAAYRRHIAHMISLQGGSSTQKIVYSQEWRENAYKQQEAEALSRPPHPAEDSAHAARPSSAPSSHRVVLASDRYKGIPKQPPRMRHTSGDIPAWSVKEYETSPELDGSRGVWPVVPVSGKDTARPKTTQWHRIRPSVCERVAPVLGCLSKLHNADIRLAVPVRESLGNKHMSSHLLSINRSVDHHGELTGHTHNTPLFAAHRVRAISLPRGGRV